MWDVEFSPRGVALFLTCTSYFFHARSFPLLTSQPDSLGLPQLAFFLGGALSLLADSLPKLERAMASTNTPALAWES